MNCLSPSNVDFFPFNRNIWKSAETKTIDSTKVSIMPNVKCGVKNVRFLQEIQLRFRIIKLILYRYLKDKEIYINLNITPKPITWDK